MREAGRPVRVRIRSFTNLSPIERTAPDPRYPAVRVSRRPDPGLLTCHHDRMPKLTEDEYKATMDRRPIAVDPGEAPPFDFWPYFSTIPPADFGGHDFSAGAVPYAWRMPDSGFQHVLVGSQTPNVFLVLVLNVAGRSVAGHHLLSVAGHHLLDLNQLYGLA
jgi:hypothetical protein